MLDLPLISTIVSLLGLAQGPAIPLPLIAGDHWQNLNSSVSGRLYTTGKTTTGGPCHGIAGYLGTAAATRTSQMPLGVNLFDQTAQAQLDACFATSDNFTRYFIDVRKPSDVSAAFHFAQQTKVPLIASNLVTDFCRSTAQTSLALWTDNMNGIKYIPRFFPSSSTGLKSVPAISYEIGASPKELVEFADTLSFTVIAGSVSDPIGGADGIQGVGTNPLASTFGLGADNILELEVVTPDGKYRKVNQFENPDLWFALRGGGAGNFAVVLRVVLRVHPKIKLQTFWASFDSNDSTTRMLIEFAASNAVNWAKDGWGGYIRSHDLTLTNPKLGQLEAQQSLRPLTDFLDTLGNKLHSRTFLQHGSQKEFEEFTTRHELDRSDEHARASRLITGSNFATEASRQSLVRAILRGSRSAPEWSINLVTPYNRASTDTASTSMNPAIYDSIWNVAFSINLKGKSGVFGRRLAYSTISKVATYLRYITPDSGTCFSHADLSEPNHEKSFWGKNYPKLLEVKQTYDPENILTTWRGVGWQGQGADPRFSCYTPSRLTWVRCDNDCQ